MDASLIFSYNEVFGPFSCEVDGCGKEAWHIAVSEDEQLPDGDRFERSCFIFRNNLGRAVCDEHLKGLMDET